MANRMNINVNAKLDVENVTRQINADLKEVEKNISAIPLSVTVDTDSFQQQTSQIKAQLANMVQSNNVDYKIPINFDVNPEAIKAQLQNILNKIQTHAGTVVDFKMNIADNGQIDSILLKYRNKLNEVTNSILAPDKNGKWTETIQSISQNLEQTESKANKLTEANIKQSRTITELAERYKVLQEQLGKLQVGNPDISLNDENIKAFNDALNSNDVKGASHYLSLLRSEYQQLSAALSDTSAQRKQQNSINELIERYKKLQVQMENFVQTKSQISLNEDNVAGFKNAIDSKDVKEATYYLTMLRSEYQRLNVEIPKRISSDSISNLQVRIQDLVNTVSKLTAQFNILSQGKNTDFIKHYSSQMDIAKSEIVDLQTKVNMFNKADSADKQAVAFKNLSNSVKQTKNDVNGLTDAYQTLNRAESAMGNFEKFIRDNSKLLEKSGAVDKVSHIRSEFKDLFQADDINELHSGFKQVTSDVKAFEGEIKRLNFTGRSVFGELTNDLKKQAYWLLSGTALFGTVGAIKKMVSNVQDLNKSMVNIQIASGVDDDEAQKMMTTYNKMGQTLGATTTEVADSADEWLRQGKSVSDTNKLIKDSMMLSKLGEINSADATQYLTSAMKGYGISVDNAVGIVDKLTKVDQISATSAGGLAEGMSKTANSAKLANISMDKLIGYLATIGETTQKPMNEVGTSLQAIFSRMSAIAANKNVDDLGEPINNVDKVLKKVNIDLRDSKGNFNNFGDILDKLGRNWKSYSNAEQNQITTAIAGIRQRENLLTLLNNYDTATKYATASTESAGTATKKMSSYTNGLEAHLKAFKDTFEQLSATIVNSKVFAGLTDAANTFLKILNQVVSKLGLLPTILTGISGAYSLRGKSAGIKYAPFLKVA